MTSSRNCSGKLSYDFRSFSPFSTPAAAACHAARSSSVSAGAGSGPDARRPKADRIPLFNARLVGGGINPRSP